MIISHHYTCIVWGSLEQSRSLHNNEYYLQLNDILISNAFQMHNIYLHISHEYHWIIYFTTTNFRHLRVNTLHIKTTTHITVSLVAIVCNQKDITVADLKNVSFAEKKWFTRDWSHCSFLIFWFNLFINVYSR